MIAEKEQFFEQKAASRLALTYDDVRIETAPSDYAPSEVDINSHFSRNVELKSPFISAAMDTVTESKMAIAMAKLGGIGVIHAGLDLAGQRAEVRRVKLHLNGLVERPVTVDTQDTLNSVLRMCEERNYDFRTFPVVDSGNRLVGLLTQTDFDLGSAEDTVEDAMTPSSDIETASPGTSVLEAYTKMRQAKKKTLPLINDDLTVAGMYVYSDVRRIVEGNSGLYNVDENGRLRVAAAVPTDEEALERIAEMRSYLDVAVIDSAQGDSKFALHILERLKEEHPNLDVVVGNISSRKSAQMLAEAGADGIKVGQGPGSICTTREETGIGSPQVTAIYECVKGALRGSKDFIVPVCADGGIVKHGDPSIAIAAGAHSVMMGGKLAGTTEAPGDIIRMPDGSRFKEYRGMGSPAAIRDSAAARKRYGALTSDTPLYEGVESLVPYEGSVTEILGTFVKALRKSMSYVGAANIEEHRRNTLLFQITNAGLRESSAHDVQVTAR